MNKFENKWMICCAMCLLMSNVGLSQTISRIEYFIDNDPGFGNAIPITHTPSSQVNDLPFTVNLSAVTLGLHQLFARSQNSNGWSITARTAFVKVASVPPNVQKLEYFINTDPGFGNATTIVFSAQPNVENISFNVDLSAAPDGFNSFFVRSFDGSRWSISTQYIFVKGIINSGNVDAIEYFIGSDLGFGDAQPVSLTPANNINDLIFNVNTSSLADGEYRLFVRSKETTGNWSITAVVPFTKGTVLPVQLLNFNATHAPAKKVLLQWQTANEINNKKFVVEHSLNGTSYSAAGEVPASTAAGNTHSYSFIHSSPSASNNNWYRLKQVDIDETVSYSPVKILRFSANGEPGISVYPTLVQHAFVVQNAPLGAMIAVFDATGKKIVSIAALSISTQTVQIGHLVTGSYIVVIHQQGKILSSEKIIKL